MFELNTEYSLLRFKAEQINQGGHNKEKIIFEYIEELNKIHSINNKKIFFCRKCY